MTRRAQHLDARRPGVARIGGNAGNAGTATPQIQIHQPEDGADAALLSRVLRDLAPPHGRWTGPVERVLV